jgi:hypothetical protein
MTSRVYRRLDFNPAFKQILEENESLFSPQILADSSVCHPHCWKLTGWYGVDVAANLR